MGSFTWTRVIGLSEPESQSLIYKVVRKDNRKVYAIKVLSKQKLLCKKTNPLFRAHTSKLEHGSISCDTGVRHRTHNINTLINEFSILKKLPSSNFIVHCRFAFQDEQYCYIGMEHMHGGDLRHYLELRRYPFDYKEVRFYMASISLALVHLHFHGIIHRDVRPESILIDSKGKNSSKWIIFICLFFLNYTYMS